jgi:hypothetical protein
MYIKFKTYTPSNSGFHCCLWIPVSFCVYKYKVRLKFFYVFD